MLTCGAAAVLDRTWSPQWGGHEVFVCNMAAALIEYRVQGFLARHGRH